MGTILAILIAKFMPEKQQDEEKEDGLDEFEAVAETTLNQTSTLYKNVQRVYEELSRNPSVKNDPLITCKLFYKIQTMHPIGSTSDTVEVPVYLTDKLHKDWEPHIETAINEINLAAPGLNIFITNNDKIARVIVDRSEGDCYTVGHILEEKEKTCTVCFANKWSGSKKATSVHELLHALGFQREIKRMYASLYVNLTCTYPKWQHQYNESDNVKGITRFDPLSIMRYPENEDEGRCEVMSELDKVGLNLLYRPCRRDKVYNPKIKGLVHYCGRETTAEHINPCFSFIEGKCGPHNGPNCPACRVLIVERWQGLSGYFYCGNPIDELKTKIEERVDPSTGEIKMFEHDSICGIKNGYPCNPCGQLLDATYDINNKYGPWPIEKI